MGWENILTLDVIAPGLNICHINSSRASFDSCYNGDTLTLQMLTRIPQNPKTTPTKLMRWAFAWCEDRTWVAWQVSSHNGYSSSSKLCSFRCGWFFLCHYSSPVTCSCALASSTIENNNFKIGLTPVAKNMQCHHYVARFSPHFASAPAKTT